MDWDCTDRPERRPTLVIELHDGRRLDLSGVPVAEVIDRLRAMGVTRADIKNTWHYIRKGSLP